VGLFYQSLPTWLKPLVTPLTWAPQKCFQGGGQRQHFAHIFQIVDDAMQMEVNKTLYPFYAPEIMPRVHGRWKGAWEDQGPGY